MTARKDLPPALVLGCNVANCLAVLRALGKKRVPLMVCGTGNGFVERSRWHSPWPRHPEPQPATLASSLAELGSVSGALLPCSDPWVRAVAALPEELRSRYPASIPSADSTEICLDKGRFAETLEALDLPRPRTMRVDPRALPDASEFAGMNVLKPRDSFAFDRRFGRKVFSFETPAEARTRIEECHSAGLEMVLQEFIPGPSSAHYFLDGFVDRHGEVRAMLARRRIRGYPEDFGNSCCLVTIPLESMRETAAHMRRLLEAIRFRGLFSAEFKRDARDGELKFIEVNIRAWGPIGLALNCGVDLVEMAYRDALEWAVASVTRYPVGRSWVDLAHDRAAAVRLVRAGHLSWFGFARSWMGATFDIASLSDPMPGIAEYWRRWKAWRGKRTA